MTMIDTRELAKTEQQAPCEEDLDTIVGGDSFFEGSDGKKGGKKNCTSLLCALAFMLLAAWTSYTLYEIFTRGIADGKVPKEQDGHIHMSQLSHPKCGKIQCYGNCKTRVRKMVGGVIAERGDWPWMVEIKINGKFTCGGVLLNEAYVISAAHCFHSNKREIRGVDIQVFLGSNNRDLPESWRQELSVCELHVHEDFDPTTLENDLALLKLKQPAKFSDYISPVCIPKFTVNRPGFIVGWGKEKPNSAFSSLLKQAEMPMVPLNICKPKNDVIYRRVKLDPLMHLCVGYGNKSQEYACAGDSGGGFFQNRFGRWFLQGVISWNDPSCNSSIHDTYTVLSNLASYTNWIGASMDLPIEN